jgi:hypothetical protein
MSIQHSRSTAHIQGQQDLLTCLEHTRAAGLFCMENPMVIDKNKEDSRTQEIFERQPVLEDIWKKKYDDRKQDWKKKAQAVPLQTTHPCFSTCLVDNTQICNIHNGDAFRNMSFHTENNIHLSTIHQHIAITDADREIDVEDVVKEFTLNKEQTRAFRINQSHLGCILEDRAAQESLM